MKHLIIRKMFAEHNNRDLKTYTLDELEGDYQDELIKFSPSYLKGASWYVGPSFKNYYIMCNKYQIIFTIPFFYIIL